MNKNKIENTIKKLLDRPEINFAYIFGSFNSSKKYNDIDIAIYLNQDFNYDNLTIYPFGYESVLLGELCLALKTNNIDLIILNKSDLLLSTRVYNTGKLLFERNRLFRVKVENSVRKEYIDTEFYRKLKSYYLQKNFNVRYRSN
jgi:predicted nucleotidyltransferase